MPNRTVLFRLAACMLGLGASLLPAQEPGDIYPDWNVLYGQAEFRNAEQMLAEHLSKLNKAIQSDREKAIKAVRSGADLQRLQDEIRSRLAQALGPMPARTPLNARQTGALERDGYTVEKVVFESRPRTYVTANVYRPARIEGRRPAVLANVGHWGAGKAFEDYQRMGAFLARRGYVVLAYDLPGMGERVQTYSPVMQRPLIHPGVSEYFVTTEHGLLVGQTSLVRGNLVSYLLWDAVRAVDYLSQRPDVDPQRIAVAGISGGGWLTELLAAYDPRVKVAIPVCYGGCSADRLFWSRLVDLDIDALIAPRPLLLIEATGDSRGSVQHKIDNRQLIAGVYEAAGAPDRNRFMLAESRHGFTGSMFPVALEWLSKWLGEPAGAPAGSREVEMVLESEADLAATVTGQVSTALAGETVFSLNRAEARGIKREIAPPGTREDWKSWRDRLRASVAARLSMPEAAAPVEARVLSRSDKGAYTLERIVYFSEPGIYVPSVLLLPKRAGKLPGVVFVNDDGKTSNGAVERYIVPLAEAGTAVLAIDVRGFGETNPGGPAPATHDYRNFVMGDESDFFFGAALAGKTVLGMRVFDAIRGAEYLRSRPEIDAARTGCAGTGTGAVMALYAAALDDRMGSASLIGGLVSYAEITETQLYAHNMSAFAPQALRYFDLPDAAALVAPRPLAIVNASDAAQRRLELPEAQREYATAQAVYSLLGAGSRLTIAHADSAPEIVRQCAKTASMPR